MSILRNLEDLLHLRLGNVVCWTGALHEQGGTGNRAAAGLSFPNGIATHPIGNPTRVFVASVGQEAARLCLRPERTLPRIVRRPRRRSRRLPGRTRAKYDKAVPCLVNNRHALLTFCDFPAEHWDRRCTSNPIESVFALGAAPSRPHQGHTVPGHRPAHALQARHRRRQDMAQAEGREPVAQGRPGRHIPKRRRGDRHPSTERRLITASPRFQHSSNEVCL